MTDEEAPPPLSSIEAEAALLGALMMVNSLIDAACDIVRDVDFAEPLFGRAFALLVSEHAAGRNANPVSLAPYFRDDPTADAMGGPGFLARLTGSSASIIGALDFARQIRDLAARRRLLDTLRDIAGRVASPDIDLSELVATADTALSDAVTRDEGTRLFGGDDAADWVIQSMDTEVTGVHANDAHPLDRLIGHLQPGNVYIIAARPGMGKTAVVASYMRATALAGFASLFVSIEMPFEQLSERLVSDQCHARGEPVPMQGITKRRLSLDQRRSVSRGATDLRGLPFRIIDKNCHTLSQLRRAVRRRKRQLAADGRSLDLVIVDYLQLLHPDIRPNSETEGVTEVSRALKRLAADEDVAVIALAQLNRAVEERVDKRPGLSDLRSSGQIEADADAVVFLLSQEYYLKHAEPSEQSPEYIEWRAKFDAAKDEIEFICAKNRHGSTGNLIGRYYREYQAVR